MKAITKDFIVEIKSENDGYIPLTFKWFCDGKLVKERMELLEDLLLESEVSRIIDSDMKKLASRFGCNYTIVVQVYVKGVYLIGCKTTVEILLEPEF